MIGSGSTRKRKGGPIDMGSNVKANSNYVYSREDQPTNIAVHSSCKDENAVKVVLRTLTLKSLIHQKTSSLCCC